MSASYDLPDTSSYGSSSSTPWASATSQPSSDNVVQSSASSYTDAANTMSNVPITPDVVANPWNTSLLWSSGIIDNRDPRSSFWPASNWRNTSVPDNVNTSPIDYYYTSLTAGDSVNFYFTGHGLSVLDYRGPFRGKYNVTIDNTTSVIIDAYSHIDELADSSGTQLPPAIWTSDTFDEGTHYVVMSNLNNFTDMNFWGVVINPNNYRPGKSFMPATSNTKVIIIASTLTAVVMIGLFLLIGSLLYYYKLVRPRRLLQAQIDNERKDVLLPPRSSSSNFETSGSRRSSRLRLDVNFLASQGDLGRVPSRVTATTTESQYWVRSQTELPQGTDMRQSSRAPAIFQEIRLDSSQVSATSSPTDLSPVSEINLGSTIYSTENGQPFSPLSATTPAHVTAQAQPHHPAPWNAESVTNSRSGTNQPPSHQRSGSMNLYSSSNGPAALPAGTSTSYLHHSRNGSLPYANPFQDPTAPAANRLARTGSRRPLPMPPTATSPVSTMAHPSPSATSPTSSAADPNHSGTTETTPQASVSVDRSASQRYRIEQDACSFHLSEDGMFDDHTGETLLPPPYAPRDMGRHFV